MNKRVFFLNMFPDYEPPEALKSALSQAAIAAADIDPERRAVEVALEMEHYVPRRLMQQASKDICALYGLQILSLRPVYPGTELHNIESEELMALFVEHNSMNRGALAGASWAWEDNILTVQLRGNGKKLLEEAVPSIQRDLLERFGVRVDIVIQSGQSLSGEELFQAMEKLRSEVMADRPTPVFRDKKKEADKPQSEAFYGKPIRGSITPMKDLNLDMGSVIVEGRVFAVEHKELKKRNAWVINFDMTDNYGSVRINRFMEANEARPILENVKQGAVLKVQGKLELNRYDNELVLKPFAMMPGSMPKRMDLAEGEKRVELHLHTSMSNMDALTDTATAVKQAAAWGHRPHHHSTR